MFDNYLLGSTKWAVSTHLWLMAATSAGTLIVMGIIEFARKQEVKK